MLGNAQAPNSTASGAKMMTLGSTSAVFNEQLDGWLCIGSEGFVLEGDAVWLLWHQTGLCDAAPANQEGEPDGKNAV